MVLKSLKNKYGLNGDKKTVLYAPTWIHNKNLIKNEFMNPKNIGFIEYLDSIAEDLRIEIIFRPHLNTNFSKNEINKINKMENIFFMPQSIYDHVEDLLILSEILITDYSSISLDYILLEKPVLFLNVKSSFNLGEFDSEFLRYGKEVDHKEIKEYIKKYLNQKIDYFKDCPNHITTMNKLYDDLDTFASTRYLERISKYF